MAAPKRLAGPLLLTTTLTTNIYNPAATVLARIRQIHIANATAASAKASIWLGATGGNANGTELLKGHVIPANDERDFWWPAGLPLKAADFIVGGSDTGTALTILITGDEDIIP